MRYDKVIKFHTISSGGYNPETGDYEDDTSSEVSRFCNMQSMSMDTMTQLYGKVKQNAYTVSLLQPYKDEYEYVSIDGKPYHVDQVVTLRTKQILYLSERK